jgi:hypothetical protein
MNEEKFAIVVCVPVLGVGMVSPVAILVSSNDVPMTDISALVREEFGENATWKSVPVRRIVLSGWRIG